MADQIKLTIGADDLMALAKRLITEQLPDCDEDFMSARAHGIGSLHAEILQLAATPAVPPAIEGLMKALQPIIDAVNVNDGDTLGSCADDSSEIWTACGSLTGSRTIRLGDLRRVTDEVEALLAASQSVPAPDATGMAVMREALEKLENGALNVAENAKARGDAYDTGYAEAMAKCANEALAACVPAPDVGGLTQRDLEQRAIGRSEAAAMVLEMDPDSDLFEGCFESVGVADTGDYSTHWLDAKVHEFFKTADTTWSKLADAEEKYWNHAGLSDEAERMHAEAKAMLRLDWYDREAIGEATRLIESTGNAELSTSLRAINSKAGQVLAAHPADPEQAKLDSLAQAGLAAALGNHAKGEQMGGAQVAKAEQVKPRSIVITLRQAEKLVEFFGGDDTSVTVSEPAADWE